MKKNKTQPVPLYLFGNSRKDSIALIREFEGEVSNPFITMRLSKAQRSRLVGQIILLPYPYYRILCLYYCCGYSHQRIQRTLKHRYVRGIIGYCKDMLTQRLGLPRPIAEEEWRTAVRHSMSHYTFDQ